MYELYFRRSSKTKGYDEVMRFFVCTKSMDLLSGGKERRMDP